MDFVNFRGTKYPRQSWRGWAFDGFLHSLYISVSRIFKIKYIYLPIYPFFVVVVLTSADGAALNTMLYYPLAQGNLMFSFSMVKNNDNSYSFHQIFIGDQTPHIHNII